MTSGFSPLLAGGREIAAQRQERRRPGQGAPAPGDLLLQLHYPQVALGLVAGISLHVRSLLLAN
jgi:hypothetical protein